MTLNTQKTANTIARIMELDANRTQGKWKTLDEWAVVGKIETIADLYQTEADCDKLDRIANNANFIASAPTMATTIRELLEVIQVMSKIINKELKVMHQAKVYTVGLAGRPTMEASHARQCMWRLPLSVRDNLEDVIAYAEPLMKLKGGER
jgi:hypothetical protein